MLVPTSHHGRLLSAYADGLLDDQGAARLFIDIVEMGGLYEVPHAWHAAMYQLFRKRDIHVACGRQEKLRACDPSYSVPRIVVSGWYLLWQTPAEVREAERIDALPCMLQSM